MTLSIGVERRERARQPRDDDTEQRRRPRLIRKIQGTAIGATMLGVTCLTTSFWVGDWRWGVAGSIFAMIATMSTALWCMHNLLADRGEFYRRGQVEGWFRGWNGQEPNGGDPLLK